MAEDPSQTPVPIGEIDHGPSKAEQFFEDNSKAILIAVIALVLIGVIVIVARGLNQAAEESAGAVLLSAEDAPALNAVITDHPNSAAAGSAHLLLADKLWEDDDQAKAIETLQSFLADYSDHPAKFSALGRLGSFYMSEGQLDEAKQPLQQIIDDSKGDYMAPYALNILGDIAKAQGDLESAKAYYERSSADYASRFDATVRGDSQARLGLLEFEAPTAITVEVPDPVAPETPPAPAAPEIPEPTPATEPAPNPAPEPDSEQPTPPSSAEEQPTQPTLEVPEETPVPTPAAPEEAPAPEVPIPGEPAPQPAPPEVTPEIPEPPAVPEAPVVPEPPVQPEPAPAPTPEPIQPPAEPQPVVPTDEEAAN